MVSKQTAREYPTYILREQLRQRSIRQSDALARSVARLTSCDALPCPEYRQEVEGEYSVVDKLLYLQQCRSALEQCIASGAARLRYRWRDGTVTDTRFHCTAPGRVRVSGLPLAG